MSGDKSLDTFFSYLSLYSDLMVFSNALPCVALALCWNKANASLCVATIQFYKNVCLILLFPHG